MFIINIMFIFIDSIIIAGFIIRIIKYFFTDGLNFIINFIIIVQVP
jgi:hypothetical protein